MLKTLLFISALFLFTSQLKANQPPCEVWNYDTQSCELFAEQNLTVNPNWQEFYNNENNNILKEIK